MDLFLPMLGVGLVTSVHCVAMCGSMVLTYAVKDGSRGSLSQRVTPHVAYQTAKIASYVVVGLALGAVGSVFDFGGLRGWVTVFAGAFMVLMGLSMTGRVPWMRRLTLRPPKILIRALSRTRSKAKTDAEKGRASLATPIAFGALTGLMPCGPLQAAQLAAAATGSPIAGATAMLGFGLGTAPLMLGFGAVSGMLTGRFKDRMMIVAAALVMVLGLVMLDRGAMLVGSPVTYQSVKTAVLGGPAMPDGETTFTAAEDGVVEVPLTIASVKFQPSALRIPADKPVRLVVDRQEDNACSDELVIPQMGVRAKLAPFGTTVIDVPASKAGSYTLTCGMGMMYGQVISGSGAASSAGSTTSIVALSGIVGLALLWLLYRTRPVAQPVKGKAAPAPVGVLGLTPSETILAGGALGLAVLLGMTFGNLPA